MDRLIDVLKILTFTLASLAFSVFKTNFHPKLENYLLHPAGAMLGGASRGLPCGFTQR